MGTQGWIALALVGLAVATLLWRLTGKGTSTGCGCASGSCCGKADRKP